MNDTSDGLSPTKGVSIQFLLIAGLFAGVIIAGPWIMYQVMVMQEQSKIAAPYADPEKTTDDPKPQAVAESGAQGSAEAGRGAQAGGGGGGRQFDPEAFFATRDADSNGKLEGEEISERMQGRLEQIDTDKDGALSKEEFLAGMQNRGGGSRGGGGSRDGAAPEGQPENPVQPTKVDGSEKTSDKDGQNEANEAP